jgi:hypothetical protein
MKWKDLVEYTRQNYEHKFPQAGLKISTEEFNELEKDCFIDSVSTSILRHMKFRTPYGEVWVMENKE